MSFGANSYVGLALSARNTNLLDTATFDSFALAVEFNDGIPGAWRQQYFGNSPTTNNLSCAGGILQITNAAILLQPQRFYRISARNLDDL